MLVTARRSRSRTCGERNPSELPGTGAVNSLCVGMNPNLRMRILNEPRIQIVNNQRLPLVRQGRLV